MSWTHVEERILQLLQGESPKGVFSLLGPKNSGKSDCLTVTLKRAEGLGFPAAYLDARECSEMEPDLFFRWITQALRKLWPLPLTPSPRLDFIPALLATAQSFTTRGMLIIDHVEFLSDENAHELISTLREYQEKIDRASRKQILCVIGGRISMMELRRRANSPNLQFDFETLPPGRKTDHNEEIKEYFAKRNLAVEPAALNELATTTGGEKVFLRMLDRYLQSSPVQKRAVESAVKRLVKEFNDQPFLLELAQLYWIDHELQRCADLLLNDREAYLGDGSGNPRDIDILQLRGALIGHAEYPFPYEFRNGIVRSLFEALYQTRRQRPHPIAEEYPFQLMVQGSSSWHDPKTLEGWRAAFKQVWQVLLGRPEEIRISFALHSRPNWSREEEWIRSIPNASCRLSGKPLRLQAAVQLQGGWSLLAEVKPAADFDSSVRCRHRVECWLSFFARGAERALLFYQAEIGEQELRHRHERETGPQNRSVFVVHGRDHKKRQAVYDLLRALKLEPLDWESAKELTGKATPFVYEIIDVGMSNAQACVLLLTGDDQARLLKRFQKKDEPQYECLLTPQARPNVIFEAGLALGKYERRAILVQFGNIRPFSDVGAFYILQYEGEKDLAFRKALISSLRTAKCPVDDSTEAWKTEGDFSAGDTKRVEEHRAKSLRRKKKQSG